MKKYIQVSTGEPVNIGDYMIKTEVVDGGMSRKYHIPIEVTEETIPMLIKLGAIKEATIDVDSCVEHLASRIGWKVENLSKYLSGLEKISSTAVFKILLMELAYMYDEPHSGHIKNSNEVWFISSSTGEVCKLIKPIKNFKNFAAFRSKQEAENAKEVLKEWVKELF